MKQNRRKAKFPVWQYLLGFFILLTVLVFSFLLLLQFALQPYQSAKEGAVRLARDYAQVEKVDKFAVYNGRESYYSVIGQTRQQAEKAVLIARDSDQIRVYDLSQGASQAEAEEIAQANGAGRIDKTTFGYLDGQPIWEVKSGTSYYNIGFESRTLLSKEGL